LAAALPAISEGQEERAVVQQRPPCARAFPYPADTWHPVDFDIPALTAANFLWGALRLHGELLKLGIEVSQATVAKYMVKRRKPPSQPWRTFLENHVNQLVSVDFFVVPTVTFRILYVFLVLAHDRRRIVH
jgi:hypothetical protein